MHAALTPTSSTERIGSLDFLRGIAILGILIINIESFAYPEPWSPYKYGFASSADINARFWVYLFFQGKFFSMLSLLFGAGFYIFLERQIHHQQGIRGFDIYARRLGILFLIGLLHAYLIWNGDILYHYAAIGFFLFPFRTMAVNKLLLLILIPVTLLLYQSFTHASSTADNQKRFELLSLNGAKSEEDSTFLNSWESRITPQQRRNSTEPAQRQTLFDHINENATHTTVHKGEIFYKGIFYRTLIMMLLGIVLYKTSIFSNYRRFRYYWILTFGLLVIACWINYLRYHHWTFNYHEPVMNTWKALLFTFPKELLGLAYVLLFNGVHQEFLRNVRWKPLSTVGRMALTNYILQSIFCAYIFYGFGMGIGNRLSRIELLLIIVPLWIILIAFSMLWLSKHSYGPLEWLWRKLTYNIKSQRNH